MELAESDLKSLTVKVPPSFSSLSSFSLPQPPHTTKLQQLLGAACFNLGSSFHAGQLGSSPIGQDLLSVQGFDPGHMAGHFLGPKQDQTSECVYLYLSGPITKTAAQSSYAADGNLSPDGSSFPGVLLTFQEGFRRR